MNDALSHLPVSSADIDAAARVIAAFAVRTPLLSPPVLNERAGAKIFLKPEMLQRTGSFKFRGAFNKTVVDPAGCAQRRRGGVLLRQPRARASRRRPRSSTCPLPS